MISVVVLALIVAGALQFLGLARMARRLGLLAVALVAWAAVSESCMPVLHATWQATTSNPNVPMGAVSLVLLGYASAVVAILHRWWLRAVANDPQAAERDHIRRRGRPRAPAPPSDDEWLQ